MRTLAHEASRSQKKRWICLLHVEMFTCGMGKCVQALKTDAGKEDIKQSNNQAVWSIYPVSARYRDAKAYRYRGEPSMRKQAHEASRSQENR